MKNKFDENQKKIRRRLLEVIHDANLSHIGSCINVIDLIDAVYSVKKKNEKFVLSNGHAAMSLYIILEKYKYIKDVKLENFGVHPDRAPEKGIDLSTGSLGQGLPIAIGFALADKNKNVYCIVSDGECAEGSIWESLRIIHDLKINNLKLIISANGWGAYDSISSKDLENRFKGFGFKINKVNGHNTNQIIEKLKVKNIESTVIFAKTSSEQFKFLKGLDAHYCTMNEADYEKVTKDLK